MLSNFSVSSDGQIVSGAGVANEVAKDGGHQNLDAGKSWECAQKNGLLGAIDQGILPTEL